ncbi:MAG: hypothetical protein WBH08_05860, partial [Methanothrix sp.]|uniref:hypothetical protein n=1 Tax=Methanothrix sp. TaxID=90426 RepID=UPI003C794DA9
IHATLLAGLEEKPLGIVGISKMWPTNLYIKALLIRIVTLIYSHVPLDTVLLHAGSWRPAGLAFQVLEDKAPPQKVALDLMESVVVQTV